MSELSQSSVSKRGKVRGLWYENYFYSYAKKLIFTRKVLHLASFWKWEFLKLRRARYEGFDLRVEAGGGGKLWIRWEKYF